MYRLVVKDELKELRAEPRCLEAAKAARQSTNEYAAYELREEMKNNWKFKSQRKKRREDFEEKSRGRAQDSDKCNG